MARLGSTAKTRAHVAYDEVVWRAIPHSRSAGPASRTKWERARLDRYPAFLIEGLGRPVQRLGDLVLRPDGRMRRLVGLTEGTAVRIR